MNQIIANIYGTGGFEKVASEGVPTTLSDLALMIAQQDSDGSDLEKVASDHGLILDNLVAFDRAGRSIAHQEFFQMEKAASEGDASALEEFFSDVVEPEDEYVSSEDLSELKQAVLEELQRRVG